MTARNTLTADEVAYVAAQRLGRLATVDPAGAPQVNPVSCYVNGTTGTIDIGGHRMAASRKYRNAARPGARAAVVIDDMTGRDPSTIRCLEIRGRVEAVDEPSDSAAGVPGAIIRVHPEHIISWGID